MIFVNEIWACSQMQYDTQRRGGGGGGGGASVLTCKYSYLLCVGMVEWV